MKRIFYGIIIGDILLAAVFVFALLLPLTRSIRQRAEAFISRHREFEHVQSIKEELQRFRAFAEQRAGDIAALRAAFIDPDTPLGLVKFLERESVKGNVRMSIAPGVVKKESGSARSFLEFQVQGTGPYLGVANLLKHMERAPFAVSLSSASVQYAEQGVRFSVTLKGLVR